MKPNEQQKEFIERCRKKSMMKITGEQLAAAMERLLLLGKCEIEEDQLKVEELCRKLLDRGLGRGQIRSQVLLRAYGRRLLEIEPKALDRILATIK